MRFRGTAAVLTLLLAFGAVACDDTVSGIQEDAQELEQEAGEAVEDLQDE